MKKETNTSKGVSIVMATGMVIAGGLGGYLINETTHTPEVVTVEVNKTIPVIVDKIVKVPYNVTKEVIVNKTVQVEVPYNVTVEKIVEVDNEDMEFVLCRLEDQNIIDDCDEIVEELKAEDAALKTAIEFLEESHDLFDMLEEEDIVEDEDRVSVVKIYSDFEDVEVLDSNFDNEFYKFEVKVKIEDEQKDVKKFINATVKVNDGEAVLEKVVED